MRQYILTERAHLMCPNMHFGIKAKIAAGYDKGKVQDVLRTLASAHPFLKSSVAREVKSGKLYYCWREELQAPVFEKDNSSLWSNDYMDITRCGWDAFHECLLKIVLYPGDAEFEVMFIAHHLLGDGRSLLGLVCEFADCYISGKKPTYAEENLIMSIDELPKGSQLSTISKLMIGYANRKWKNEKHTVNYEDYRRFEREFIANNSVSYIEEEWSTEKTEEVLKKCHEQSLSLNDYLVAEMMCKEKTSRVVIAVDIRKHLSRYQSGALGNYASATAIEVSNQSGDIESVAKSVSEKVKKNIGDPKKLLMILACYLNMRPELIDAAAISVMGGFESEAGKFVGSLILGYKNRNGHSVTNLGNVDNPNLAEAMFIPPASPANAKTMGVLSVNHRLRKCTAYYQ
ncbi:hypothetical protein [Sinanaerobacter sp. ZZT-01]|uniref:hypothetical protein n=1 Tax=Sinanaerobacter sp. ZZT-01 TaxID=3111540 RepID=UPI002D780468|nr:hypothetical protein [Sinanaerobacter sp. ZZT-01]WRR94488.1 hypothetical protein U5921_05050 [Sinanaerobacter sp. ZZT-01]